MHELALFAGAGGGILGGHLLGWRCVCAIEINVYARSVLVARQNDGTLSPFPIWDDVRTFDGRPWRGRVDVVSGGFPCQDISVAGKGAGIDGLKSGLWREMARIVGEVRPKHVLVENSPALVTRGLGRVLGDLDAMGYDARWGVLSAADTGAPHLRERIWVVATDRDKERRGRGRGPHWAGRNEPANVRRSLSDADCQRQQEEQPDEITTRAEHASAERGRWWAAEPDVARVVHGLAHRVDRVAALGNGQVPAVVRLAWETLTADQRRG